MSDLLNHPPGITCRPHRPRPGLDSADLDRLYTAHICQRATPQRGSPVVTSPSLPTTPLSIVVIHAEVIPARSAIVFRNRQPSNTLSCHTPCYLGLIVSVKSVACPARAKSPVGLASHVTCAPLFCALTRCHLVRRLSILCRLVRARPHQASW